MLANAKRRLRDRCCEIRTRKEIEVTVQQLGLVSCEAVDSRSAIFGPVLKPQAVCPCRSVRGATGSKKVWATLLKKLPGSNEVVAKSLSFSLYHLTLPFPVLYRYHFKFSEVEKPGAR